MQNYRIYTTLPFAHKHVAAKRARTEKKTKKKEQKKKKEKEKEEEKRNTTLTYMKHL
jgi:ribosomal protein L12E/L44/L45/RPP1/RPP2